MIWNIIYKSHHFKNHIFQNIAYQGFADVSSPRNETKKVHRVIQFEQGDCMARWVNICTSNRAQAKSEFEKQFWKLMVRIQT